MAHGFSRVTIRRKTFIIATAFLLFAVALGFLLPHINGPVRHPNVSSFSQPQETLVASPKSIPPQSEKIAAPAKPPVEFAVPPGGSPLAQSLNAPTNTAAQDVKILSDITKQFLSAAKDSWRPPIGDNADLAAVLRGSNRHHLVFIPAGHPAFNAGGLLVDRWGTPYFIHPRSSSAIDIISAGPDKKMFTADDVK